jgi:hypothetical protein
VNKHKKTYIITDTKLLNTSSFHFFKRVSFQIIPPTLTRDAIRIVPMTP